jgi:eukaryotic-like serine/threonine-protein kinase
MQPGTQLGPYKITGQLGAGGMGEVYAATDTRLGRRVAIKVLPERLARDPERLSRFEREARTISSLNHPHICALHDVGNEGGTHFLVMEYVEGEALDKRLERGPVPLDDALTYAIQMAGALDRAHQQGIVHRDVKPANVMITRAGVKLLDFGLAKLRVDSESRPLSGVATTESDLTQEGTILGTFRYMAPEQVEGKTVDARTDIYALCLVLYEMITGRRAIDGETQASLIAAILKDKPRPLGELHPITPPQLDRVVQTGLEKDPERRWQSAREIGHALEWIRSGGPVTATSAPATNRLWKGATAALAAIGALALVLALAPGDLPSEWRLDVYTGETSDPAGFAVSPDGRQLAYVASGPDGTQLWLRRLDADEAEPLTGTEGASRPFWSPNNESIAFFSEGWLRRIDLDSRVTRSLARAPSPYGGTWRRDGTILYAPSPSSRILRVSADGDSDPVPVPTSSGSADLYPKFLDDGDDFIFSPLGSVQVHLGSLNSQDSTLLMEAPSGGAQYHPAGYLLFVRQGALLAQRLDRDARALVGEEITVADGVMAGRFGSGSGLSVSRSGVIAYRRGETRYQLGWFDPSGQQVGAAGGESTDLRWPVVDPMGRVAASDFAAGRLWVIDTETSAPRQLTFSEGFKQGPIWSPDGMWVAYRAAGENLRRKLSSGAGEEEVLLDGPGTPLPTSWSRDGSAILLSTMSNDIEYLSLDDMATHPFVADPRRSEVRGVFSPDGRWVAYESDESGRFEVYVRSFPDGSGQSKVSSDGGSFARWSPDGTELYYLSATGVLMALNVDTTGDVFGYEPARPLFSTRIAATTLGDLVHPYDVGPDRRFLMFVPVEEVPNPITVILNWNPDAD